MTKAKAEKQEPILSSETPKVSEKERKDAVKKLTDTTRAMAWAVYRWPIQRRVCEYSTKIHLPRTYLSTKGEDVRHIRKGVGVNQFVYQYYMDMLDAETNSDWVNYVHSGDVLSRRHEYLGPDPRVAGYYFDSYGEIHIRWWDGFLKNQWMGHDKWTLEATMNAAGEWVVKED